jgi:hypothetical protein
MKERASARSIRPENYASGQIFRALASIILPDESVIEFLA